jgi:hypothetical protein
LLTIQGENGMPLMKSASSEALHSNIRELVRSGYKPRQAVAIGLSNQRKYKKMAMGGMAMMSDGGQVIDKGGMENIPKMTKPPGGYNEPYSKMDDLGPEGHQRSLNEIREDGEYYPAEVANPNEMEEAQGFAEALKKKSMEIMSPEHYAMGGLVQDGPEGDRKFGTKPTENMMDTVEDVEVHAKVGKPFMENPSGMGLSMEAKAALERKKKMRRYSS